MKIVSSITLVACLSIFSLQLIWIHNSYLSYKADFMKEINNNLVTSVGKEVGYRALGTNHGKKKNNIYYKRADEMTPQEQEMLKGGDTLDLSMSNSNRIGNTIQDVFMQIQQDLLMEKNPLNLSVLDTVFVSLFNQKVRCCIKSFDRDTIITGQTGCDLLGSSRVISSKLIPIGTKGLQYVQAEAQVPMTGYLAQMILILCASLLLMVIVMAILFVQFVQIRKKTEALAAREASIRGTIHDLKAPLENMVTLLSWIADGEHDAKRQEVMQTTIARGHSLIEDIQQILIHPTKGKLTLDVTDILPDNLMEQANRKISTKLQAKPHSLIVENCLGEEPIRGDAMYLGNALKNLVENSLKYSNHDVLVCVKFYKAENYQVIEVKDNGWGIDKKYQQKIFEPYYQIQRAGKGRSGYGIGLSYVKLIIELHRGKVKLESTVNVGTTIKCYLPCKR